MASVAPPDATTLATLASLEHRLQRLTFYLTGDTELSEQPQDKPEEGHEASACARLLLLEQSLAQLAHRKSGVRGLLELRTSTEARSIVQGEAFHS